MFNEMINKWFDLMHKNNFKFMFSKSEKNHYIIASQSKKEQPNPDSKVHGANMGHTWVLPAPDGPHVGPMNLAIREDKVRTWYQWSGHFTNTKLICYY